MHRILKLINESATEEYWDATEIDGRNFMTLMKFNFGTDSKGNNYIVTNDNNEVARFRAENDEEAKKKFNEEFLKESTLTEDEEDIEDEITDIEATEDDLEDTLDSEEDQKENPVEEDSNLDEQLNELRKVLIDLDLNLYQVTSKEDPNNSIYIIGKVAEDNNDTLMLIDTKPAEDTEEISDIEIDNIAEEPEEVDEANITDDQEENLDQVEAPEVPTEEPEELQTPEERFDFVVLPKTFAEINELNPRYGEGLTPDHEAIMDYLMNCLIEINPDAVDEILQDEEPNEESIVQDDTLLPVEEPIIDKEDEE